MAYGVYVHSPWCRRHCPYCAFHVLVQRAPPWGDWLRGVLRDWQAVAPHFEGPADTLYLGGGTPSLAPDDVLAAILAAVPLVEGGERTLEVDPGTADAARLRDLAAAGFTRMSLGVQTFSPAQARRLARGHGVRESLALLEDMAALPLASWSLDLMFALPGQTLAELDQELDAVLAFAPPHVSLYGLTYEPETPLTRLRDRGRLREIDDDTWRSMYERVVERLTVAGYERYEVSNFARPGHRSRHNEATWRGGHYAGLGPSAHGHLPPRADAPWGLRTVAAVPLDRWLEDPWAEVEVLDRHRWSLDLLLSTLRHKDGLPLDRLARAGLGLAPAAVAPLADAGLVALDGRHLRILPAGTALADGLTARLAQALVPLG